MLHRVKSHNLFSFLLGSDIEEANNANMADPDDDKNMDIELWTPSPGFTLVRNRSVSYSQTLFSILHSEKSTRLICFVNVVADKVK